MTVHLVGAGPGDVDLLTLGAARLLATADAVIFDRLVGPDILALVAPSAERYDVGKAPDRPSPSQAEINDLLVCVGRRLDTVVRLKGGDPFMFGRGVEEQRACREAGIEVAVVPGISSAIAAPSGAGISITERGVSSGVCIVTAHQDPASADIDWGALAASGLTITVLMGARRARSVAQALLAGGRPADEPVAVITNASRRDETRWHGTLAELGVEPVPSPSVLVIGKAAGLAADARQRPTDGEHLDEAIGSRPIQFGQCLASSSATSSTGPTAKKVATTAKRAAPTTIAVPVVVAAKIAANTKGPAAWPSLTDATHAAITDARCESGVADVATSCRAGIMSPSPSP